MRVRFLTYSVLEQVLLHLLSYHLCVWVHADFRIIYLQLLIGTQFLAVLKRRPTSVNQYNFTFLQLKLWLPIFDTCDLLILIHFWAEVNNTEGGKTSDKPGLYSNCWGG